MLPSVLVVLPFLLLCIILFYHIPVCLSIQKLNFPFLVVVNKTGIMIQVQVFV